MDNIRKMKAKEFAFKIDSEFKCLKIDFGVHFCVDNQKIVFSEEFTLETLHEIENLQIDSVKKAAEFDTCFEGKDIHFIIKEAYDGTLCIMNFIDLFNKNPFLIDYQHKDFVSIIINKNSFDILLKKANSEDKIYLFKTNKGLFFEIYSPEPGVRFIMKSCKVTEKGLCIEHDSIDLYNNVDTSKTEYNWEFELQPEIQDLIIKLINIAINPIPKI